MSQKGFKKWASAQFGALSENVRRLANTATFDLYNGPFEEGFEPDGDDFKYPGFSEAIDLIKQHSDDIGEIWFDEDCDYASDKEPETHWYNDETDEWEEYNLESTYHYERRDVLNAIFGKELASYL